MPSLEELAANAITPVSEEKTDTPVRYKPMGASIPTLGEINIDDLPVEEVKRPPTYQEKLFADLDKAIERDKKQMMERVIGPAKEAMEANMALNGKDYFEDDIDLNESTVHIPTENEVNDMIDKAVESTTANDDDFSFLNNNDIYYKGESNISMNTNTTVKDIAAEPATPMAAISFNNGKSEMIPDAVPEVKNVNFTGDTISYPDDDEDIFADDPEIRESENSELAEEDLNEMKKVFNSIPKVNNVVDLKSYKISSKPINPGNVKAAIDRVAVPTAKWVHPNAKTPYVMSALKGTELDTLASAAKPGQTAVSRNIEIIKLFYNHIVSDKPASWEAWAKTIYASDFSHLYFGAYVATFSSANVVPFQCKNKHDFMKPVDIMDMIKFKDDKVKEAFFAAMDKECKGQTIDSELIQVSDNFAVAIRKPTVYNTMVEQYYLPENIRTKLEDILIIFNHIENIYYIDRENNDLRPVETNPDGADITKTIKNRFKIYYDILKSLTPDQLNSLLPIIKKVHENEDEVTYQYPETTCDKCGTKIEASALEASDILFIRHRLQIALA